MLAGEFRVRYRVLQNNDGTANRIIFEGLPRQLFDAIPVHERTHYSEPGSGPTFYIKSMNKQGAEWWFMTLEDMDGNIEGVLPPVDVIALPDPEDILKRCGECGVMVSDLIEPSYYDDDTPIYLCNLCAIDRLKRELCTDKLPEDNTNAI